MSAVTDLMLGRQAGRVPAQPVQPRHGRADRPLTLVG